MGAAEASKRHALVQANATFSLVGRLKGTPCAAANQLRIRTASNKYSIPDIVVVCGEFIASPESGDAYTNPKVIVEILSPSTADFDHGAKFALFCQLQSFTEYALISQDKPKVEVFFKQSPTKWILTIYEGMEALVKFESLNIEIPATEIYAGVDFPLAS